MFNIGTLLVKPQSAQLNEDLDTIGKMDPYTQVTIGSTTHKTAPANGMGKLPSWKDILTFKIAAENSILVSLWDHDSANSNDFIGECTIQLQDVVSRGNFSNWYELTKNGSSAGKVFISFEYGK